MIFSAGISIALFISALLLVKRNKSKADLFLFIWMILNALHLSFFYLLYSDIIYEYPNLLGLQFPLPLFHGVLLYYYVSSVTNQFPKKRIVVILHLLPIIVTLLYLIPFFLLPVQQKIEIFKSNGKGYETFQLVLITGVFISGIVYVVWSSLLLKNHKKRIRDEFSNIEEINLGWLQLLVYGLACIWVIVIATQNDIFIHIGQSIFVILIGFFGIQQKNIFSSNEIKSKIVADEKEKKKYTSSGLSEEKEEEYYKKLNQLVIQEKIYANPELSLSDLASKLEIHPNYLSQIINNKEGRTFYDYINIYRVEEFKRLIALPKNQQFTLMSVAYDCGFNSKSSFNRYFKKITNQTPSQYLKSING